MPGGARGDGARAVLGHLGPRVVSGLAQPDGAATGAAAATDGPSLAQEALAGSRRALARLLTAIEADSRGAEDALRVLHQRAGRAHLVGVTGPPGVGKSTLVSALTAEARSSGRTVAVLAIDPSSPITGGAILGDRIRMQQHAGDDGVFIRSMAARGHVGGLAGATARAAAALDACGFELVLIETVGTGQNEVEVAALADTTLVLQAPEMGDDVQALKAGLLEVADIVVVTRADRPGADRAAGRLRAMLTVDAAQVRAAADRPLPRRPEVLMASGTTGEGVPELLAALQRHHARSLAGASSANDPRRLRAAVQVEAILADRVRAALRGEPRRALLEATLAAVAAHELDPYAAADRLLDSLREGHRGP